MSNTIYRQDAIDVLQRLSACQQYGEEIGTEEESYIGKYEAITAISDLPSADRPQGKWIGGEIPTRCPICEHDWDEYVFGPEYFYTGDIPKYCPNCGTRLEV